MLLCLTGICSALAQPSPGRPSRGAAEILVEAGSLADPSKREQAVAALKEFQEERKRLAVERAQQLNLVIRQELPNGKVIEIHDFDDEGKPVYRETLNVNAAISTGANLLQLAPYGLSGSGVIIGMWDGGSGRATHQEFASGRMIVQDGSAAIDHATHVGGTMIAAGINASAKGMAPVASVYSYNWDNDTSEMTGVGAATSNAVDKIYLSNHSYGIISGWQVVNGGSPFRTWEWYGNGSTASDFEQDFGRYEANARAIDVLAFNAPYYLIFWSAGNERNNNPSNGQSISLTPNGSTVVTYSSSSHPAGDGNYRSGFENIGYDALAKNIVTVGAVNDAVSSGARHPASATMSAFSSWGPTDDGRIKPDLVANGVDLFSTGAGGDTSYYTSSGTSMSSPNAAGTAALLIQEFRNLFGYNMRASTLKGLMIHTATDLGNAGPDYKNGWGLIDGTSAVQVIRRQFADPGRQRMREVRLTSANRPYEMAFTWDGTSPIRATLSWTDPAGAATSTSDSRLARLVNNLDLSVIGPGGESYRPFVMPFVGTWTTASMDLPATNGINNVDNVEQVALSSPAQPGTYRVRVDYQGTLANNEQYFSLVVDGAEPAKLVDYSLSITNPVSDILVAHTMSNFSFRGTAGASLRGHFVWTNMLSGDGGSINASTNWSVINAGLQVGSNRWVIYGTNEPAAGALLAADSGNHAEYDDGWTEGDSGGVGFLGWSFGHAGANAGHFMSDSAVNQSLTGRVWGLYANNASEANAYRVFNQGMQPGDLLQLAMENNDVNPGGSVGISLLNGSSEILAEFYFENGKPNYQVNDAGGERDSGLAYRNNGVAISWALTGADSFRLVTGGVTNDGQFIPRSDMSPARFRAFNYSAGSGSDFDFFFSDLSITAGVPPVVEASATVTVVRAGQVPVIVPIPQQTATVSQAFNYTVIATDAENDAITYSVSSAIPSNTWSITLITNAAVIDYQPALAHTGLATFAFTAHDKDGSSDPVNLVVRVLPPPGLPVFNPVAPQTATMLSTTSFVVTAGGSPEPVVSLSDTTAAGSSDYNPASGVLSYTPSYADGGEQFFTFHASNTVGVITQAVIVTVAYISPPAVTALWVSATNDTSVEVSWTPVDAATGYALDVHSDHNFGEFPYYQSFVEDFSVLDAGGTNFETRTWTNNGIGWIAYKSRADQVINGTALALQNASGSFLVSGSISRGIDEISLNYRRLASGGAANFSVVVNGTHIRTAALANNTTGTLLITNLNIAGPASIVITNHGEAVAIIDDVFITSPPYYQGEFISGYAGLPVEYTSAFVEGLQPNSMYFFRVRATNSAGVSAHSPVASATTLFSQTISFAPVSDQRVTNTVGLAATASSGLPVVFSVSGPATISGGTNLSFNATGVVEVVASQAGDSTYASAPDVTNTFDVLPIPPPVMSINPGANQSFALSAGDSTNFTLHIMNSGGGSLNWTIDATSYDYREDMDDGTNDWMNYGENASWHLSTNRAYSGSYAMYSGISGGSLYESNVLAYAELPWVHLHTNAPVLRFRHWGDMEQDTSTVAWDGGLVGLVDGEGNFYFIGTTNDYTHRWYYNPDIYLFSGSYNWRESVFDLSAFAGQVVKLVFVFSSDDVFQQEGWYIDDVAISPRSQGDDWLQMNPLSGSVQASSTGDVAVTVSAASLGAGSKRNADIIISGNDPGLPTTNLRFDLVVNKESALIELSNLVHVFDGQTKEAFVVTSPAGLMVNVAYDGLFTPPRAVGDYTVVAAINSGIYEGSVTGTLSIINLEGAITVEDSIGDVNDQAMAFGGVDIGDAAVESITIRNTNTTFDLTITDIRLTGAGVELQPMAVASIDAGRMMRPSARELRTAALASTAARDPASIIVKFKPEAAGQPIRAALHANMGSRSLRSFDLVPADVVELPAGESAVDMIAAYEAHDAVEYAEPNFIYTLNSLPNDPAFTNLWGLHNTGQSGGTPGADIRALDAWAYTTGSTNVIVAVIDTGIDYNHPDLAANIWVNPNPTFGDIHGARFISGNGQPTSGDPMDDQGHGTHVAGTIGAVGNNGVGLAGVNWNVKLMALKFITSANEGSTADAIGCIEYAVENGAHLSNNSWGGGGYSQSLKDAIDAAGRANQLFIAAAGNNNSNINIYGFYPAGYDSPNVISVANSTRTDARASNSNYGTNKVHLAAPGSTIYSTMRNNSYGNLSGTSMASPHVAGVASLLLARHPDAPYADVRRWIFDHVDVLPGWSNLVQTGGRLNAAAALENAQFSVSNTNGWPIIIPPGGSVTIPVRYLPTRQENAADTVVVSNNDALHPQIEISLDGRGMLTQSIGFPPIDDQLATNVVTLSATSTSGGEVTFAASSPAVLAGDQLSFTNSGEVVVVASQAGSAFWRPAAPVTNTFQVSKVNQSIIEFVLYPVWQHITNLVPLAATASSGLPVEFSVATGPGGINAGILAFSATGEVVIAANQPGSGQWSAAPELTAAVRVYEDENLNALPDEWEAQNFDPEYEITAESDLDNDGIPDGQEFITGTDPADPSDRLELETKNSAPLPGNSNAFVIRWSSASNRFYTLVYKTNLLEAFTPISSGLAGTPPVNVFTTELPVVTSPLYYRIGVSLQP